MKDSKQARALRTVLPHLIPAGLVALAVIASLCSQAPVLEQLPVRLTATASDSAVTSQAPAVTVSPLEGQTDETPEATPSPLAGVGTYTDGVYTGSATGYGGTISVQVTVEDGQITDITVLSAEKETASFFQRAKGVISSILTAQTWEVDGVSGATYSSNGIKNAVKNALTGQETQSDPAPQVQQPTTSPVNVSYTEPSAYQDGTYTGSAQGFGGTISVQVVIQSGKISSLTILSADGETPSYLTRAKAVISKVLEQQTPNVDTVSGATYSSAGILNATKQALSKAAGEAVAESTPTPTPTPEPEPETSPTPTPEPEPIPEEATTETVTSSQVYTATALCSPDAAQQFTAYDLGLSVTVETTVTTITLITQEGTTVTTRTTNTLRDIQLLSPDASSSNWLFLQWAMSGKTGEAGVFSQILEKQSTLGIDAVTMATCSSQAMTNGVANALSGLTLGTTEETSFTPAELDPEESTESANPGDERTLQEVSE